MSLDYTQNIIVRTDLKLSKGKLCGQVAHAAVCAADEARKKNQAWWKKWFSEGQRKVVVKVNSLEDLYELKRNAEMLQLPVATIEDRGLTEIPPGTVTCIGIGPAPTILIDKVTGKLPLL